MKIVGIDGSAMVASVAVVEDNTLIGEYTINHKKTHSQTLLPMLDEMIKMSEVDWNSVDAIALTAGPGSFTGLRIASSTAKGIGMVKNIPIIPVGTMEALAFNMWGTDRLVCPMMDARRHQVYTGIFAFDYKNDEADLSIIEETCAVDVLEIIEKVNALGKPVVFLGDGIKAFETEIKESCKVDFILAPASKNMQSAAALANYGMHLFKKGISETAAEHRPDYMKLSQAERERQENGKE